MATTAKKPHSGYYSKNQVDCRLDRLTETIGKFVAGVVKPLEKRVSELEARPELRYIGVWSKDEQYVEGNCVTHDGNVFVCVAPKTKAKPGPSAAWRLAVKGTR
jgi:hypothetical protein